MNSEFFEEVLGEDFIDLIAGHVIVCFVKNAGALFFSQFSRVDDHVVHCVTVVIIVAGWVLSAVE